MCAAARRARPRPRYCAEIESPAARDATDLARLASPLAMGFTMLPNGCSWYETHQLGGCQRRAVPRKECTQLHPPAASTQHRLALLVPYRSATGQIRMEDIAELCSRMDSLLVRRGISFQVFVINQVDERPFNRGALVNAAVSTLLGQTRFSVLTHRRAFDYMAVHDIDRFPVTSNASGCESAIADYYAFPSTAPRVLHPKSFAGGVLLLPLSLFRAVNGFANSYWGWGEEDNDLFLRLRWCGLPPKHGERIDWCMEHRDCAACKRQKQLLDANVLHAHENRMRSRMEHPRRHMLRDGLSTLNFTLRGEPRRLRCGRLRATALDVNLGRTLDVVHDDRPGPVGAT